MTQKAPKRAKRPARKQSKSVWRAEKAILKKVQKVPYCRAKLEVRGALERHMAAKLQFKMASKRPGQAVLRPREAVLRPRQAQQARQACPEGSPSGLLRFVISDPG